MSKSNFNFIVGIGRSGTTLLMSMLNAHPNIQATPEVNFFNFFHHSFKNKKKFSENDISIIVDYIKSYKDINFSGFDFDIQSFQQSNSTNFKDLYENFYSNFFYGDVRKNCSYFFDKNPINSFYIKEILETFPDAKFIFLTRDPRATYLSLKQKKNTKKSANVYFNTYRWYFYNSEVYNFAKLFPEKFFVIKYEDLVLHTENELKKMAAFFGFEYNEKMLLFHEDVKKFSLDKLIDPDKQQRHLIKYSDLSKPIYPDRLSSWQKDLSAEEISIIDSITSELAEKLGYKKQDSLKYKMPFLKRLKGKLMAIMFINYNKIVSLFPLRFKLSRLNTKNKK